MLNLNQINFNFDKIFIILNLKILKITKKEWIAKLRIELRKNEYMSEMRDILNMYVNTIIKILGSSTQESSSRSDVEDIIGVGLQAMFNMGFTNEDGWLTQLMDATKGNIEEALDVLQPINSNSTRK